MKFLLVEDDKILAGAIKQLLVEHHYVVDSATDGITGRDMAEAFTYDLILLDWTLPQLDGVQLCEHLRNRGNDTPIILMTARDASTDRVAGLDAGADDYLIKPFEFEELLARIRALLRRSEGLISPILQWGELCLDPRSSEVTCRSVPVAVTPKEYALLELFLRNPNRIFSLDTLLDKVWPFEASPTVGSVRTHIKGLRQKLKKMGMPNIIATVYGLGYRLKPAELVGENDAQIPQLDVAGAASSTVEKTASKDKFDLTLLWQSVSDRYIRRVNDLTSTLHSLQPGSVEGAIQQEILMEAHALAGSLGSFGFTQATVYCREIESMLRADAFLSAQQVSQLETLATQIQQSLESRPEVAAAASSEPPESQTDFATEPTLLANELLPGQPSSLLVIQGSAESDRSWLRDMTAISARYQMQVSAASSIAQARQIIGQQLPDIVLFDLGGATELPSRDSAEFRLLAELQSVWPVPTLVLTAAASFESRVRIARMGAIGLLPMPMTPIEILETAVQVLQKSSPTAGKLLIVDDDPAMLTLLQVLLQPWGFQLQLLNEPQRFWQMLESFEPDLVLLDAKMPQISGFDLCRVLRSAPRWQDLPVLFMSGYTDAATIEQVFAAGADDYIRKPIVAPELVARVLGWLKRSHLQRLRADIDSLTGIANRRKSTQSLTRLLGLAQRQERSLCFALIDFDHFKQINDDYGHPVGDHILRRFGERLRSTFRAEDVVGRWGGEEFVVGLYGVGRQEGTERLLQFLQVWRRELFNTATIAKVASSVAFSDSDDPPPDDSKGHSIYVTFTAGIAIYPDDAADLAGLYRVADEALYQAKAAGRNRIFTR